MFDNLKINYKDAIVDLIIEDLSKINIFCGKNNSGKILLLKNILNLNEKNLFIKD